MLPPPYDGQVGGIIGREVAEACGDDGAEDRFRWPQAAMEASFRRLLGQDFELKFNRAQCYWAVYGECIRNYDEELAELSRKRKRGRPSFGQPGVPRSDSVGLTAAGIKEKFRSGTLTDEEYARHVGG